MGHLCLQLLALTGHHCLSFVSLLGDLLHLNPVFTPFVSFSMPLLSEGAALIYSFLPGAWPVLMLH